MSDTYIHLCACPHCGQVIQWETDIEFPTRKEKETAAVKGCECSMAQLEQQTNQRIIDAKNKLRNLIGQDYKPAIAIETAIEMVGKHLLDSVSFKDGNCKLVIKSVNHTEIKIVKTTTRSDSEVVS